MNSKKCTPKQIRLRQNFARSFGIKTAELIRQNSKLKKTVHCIIWHGSLPNGKGGNRWDIDYAIFLRTKNPKDLLEEAKLLSTQVEDNLQDVTWRNDLHYDGMKMFEAHTHWDPIDRTMPHIGVHLYQEKALLELFGRFDWKTNKPSQITMFRMLDSWRRFCFFYRHWIYEGVPIYDPKLIFKRAKKLNYSLPNWILKELIESLSSILDGYYSNKKEICTVSDSKDFALDLVAILAYIIEGKPIGREVRYESDVKDFENIKAKFLLKVARKKDLSQIKKLRNVIENENF